ncbi:hypothetical protein SB861_14675 [Paraburkholderia sp. SIMBA_049]
MPELGSAWLLAFVLADIANQKQGGKLYPSIEYLMARTGFSRAKVKRDLAALRERGILVDTGERCGKKRRIVVYVLRLRSLAALRKEIKHRADEVRTQDTRNGLTGEPINEDEMGSPMSPLNGGIWAQNDSGYGLKNAPDMGSPVSPRTRNRNKEENTAAAAAAAAAARACTRENAPPSASAAAAAALPDDEKTKRKPGVRRNKKPPAEANDALVAHLREYGINAAGKNAQAVLRKWANDSRVSRDVLDEAIARLKAKDDVRYPMSLLRLLVEDVLYEREHPIGEEGGLQPSRASGEHFDGFGFDERAKDRKRTLDGLTGRNRRTRLAEDPDVIDVTPNDDA